MSPDPTDPPGAPEPEAALPEPVSDDLAVANIIRTETVLSRMPIHNLAKRGRVDIRITRKNPAGEVDLKWEVSHSDRYGQPRQLAYKIDTLIVNRRIDEEGRPLPGMIRLGSLAQICKELGVPPSGKNTNDLRNAIHQNAGAYITAKLNYRSADGSEKRLEAGFTRYGVVFTGERLPDGRKADAVYVILNDPYREVLNSAPLRPLNYDYLRQLRPTAQRFYEIISYRIFAALRNDWPTARITYSDYCAYSAQQRYYDYEHFRVQMYKVHKPHLDSGYLKSVHLESATDGEGKPDWVLSYVPGPKARAEYRAFTRKHGDVGPTEEPQGLLENASTFVEETAAAPAQQTLFSEPPSSADPLLAELTRRGVNEARAKKLLALLPQGQPVLDQLEWGDYLIAQSPASFRNPPGFYVSLVRDNLVPPDAFPTTRRRKQAEEARQREEQLWDQRQKIELAYEEYRRRQLDRYIETALTPQEFQAAVETQKREYAKQYPGLEPETLWEIARGAARAEIARRLPLASFEEFAKSQSATPEENPSGAL
jgi:hypothetical protein